MRILVLTQVVVYPADAGPKVKTLQVLRHLAAHHEVIYCTYVRNEKEIQDAAYLREICSRVVTVPLNRSRVSDVRFLLESVATNDSFLMRRDDRAEMQAMVRQLLQEEQIDVLHVDQLNMMRFVPANWKGRVVLDEHNAVWQVMERLYKGTRNPVARTILQREFRLIRRIEGESCRRADVVLAVSEHDRDALREIVGEQTPIKVIPITVDAERLEHLWAERNPQPHRLFTIGTMFWLPNSEGVLWWLREGYAHLRKLCPDVTYDIVGARPSRELQTVVGELTDVGVHLHGHVADASPFWIGATVLAVPLLSGGGVRVKILEAMAIGVPVVSTTVGCEGLDVYHGEHLLIADTPEEFALACARVLQDTQLAKQLVQNARQLILERYDAKVALKTLDSVYERVGENKQEYDKQSI